MLSMQENELLCRVGAGTPMGDLLREYWVPAFMPGELPDPDGPPMRLRLLGENLVAFRTSSGKFGLMDHRCPHRGASLFFGRNEEEGLRCVYHGWKFDTEGRCVDMPSEPPESNFRNKIRAPAYPCVERNGVVWAYMGRRSTPPPLPDLLPNLDRKCRVWMRMQESNWLQALEGDIDTSHARFLHGGHTKLEYTVPGSFDYYATRSQISRFEVQDLEIGASCAAVRPAEEDSEYWRIGHFLLPFYTMNAFGLAGYKNAALAWVPLDDHHTMVWNFVNQERLDPSSTTVGGLKAGTRRKEPLGKHDPDGLTQGEFPNLRFLPRTSDWLGRFRAVANSGNDYLIDRDLQSAMGTFTGVPALAQDSMVQETMGLICDRTREHLGTSDSMIIRARRALMKTVTAFKEGAPLPGVDKPELYRMRSGGVLVAKGVNALDYAADINFDRVSIEEFLARERAATTATQ